MRDRSTPSDTSDVETLRAEATAMLEKNPDVWAFRSCWKCNSAHEHLKDVPMPVRCFVCGHIYLRGVDITIMDDSEDAEDA